MMPLCDQTGVPGVVAVATDRNANIYEGAFGVRQAGAHAPMTTDSVFALFSLTTLKLR